MKEFFKWLGKVIAFGGYIGISVLFMFAFWEIIRNSFLDFLLSPWNDLEAAFLVLTTPIFWILLAVVVIGHLIEHFASKESVIPTSKKKKAWLAVIGVVFVFFAFGALWTSEQTKVDALQKQVADQERTIDSQKQSIKWYGDQLQKSNNLMFKAAEGSSASDTPSASVSATPQPVQPAPKSVGALLSVKSVYGVSHNTFMSVNGEVQNTGDIASSGLQSVNITVYDSSGNVIGSGESFLTAIDPGQSQSFSAVVPLSKPINGEWKNIKATISQ